MGKETKDDVKPRVVFLRLKPDEYWSLKIRAAQEHQSVQAFVADLIRDALKKGRKAV